MTLLQCSGGYNFYPCDRASDQDLVSDLEGTNQIRMGIIKEYILVSEWLEAIRNLVP